MKRIGMVILTIALSINLCMGVSCVLADNTKSKTSADGQFKYYLKDLDEERNLYYAIPEKYLGSRSTLELPEKIDGYEVWYNSEEFFRSMKTVTTVVFQKPILEAKYAIYAPNLQTISVKDFGHSECFVHDGCLYGPYYLYFSVGDGRGNDPYDDSLDRLLEFKCMLYGVPGGKESIDLYKDVDAITYSDLRFDGESNWKSGQYLKETGKITQITQYLEESNKLKRITISGKNSKYQTIDGILLDEDGDVIAIPQNYSAENCLYLPSGIKKSEGTGYSNWETVVFPEGMQSFSPRAKRTSEYKKNPQYYSYEEIVNLFNSDGPQKYYFPSTISEVKVETRNLGFERGGDGVITTDWDFSFTSNIESNVKDVYINMTQERAQKNIKISDCSSDEYKVNNLNELFDFYYPNAAIHYAKAVKTGAIKNGTVTVQKDSELEGNPVAITVKANEGYQLKKLAVTDETGKEVKVKDNQFTMPDSDVTITAEFEKKSNSGKDDDNTPVTTTYTDVPVTGKWYSNAVYYATEKGYMAGTGNNKFSPEGTVTRGTIAQILYAAENKPTVTGKSKFSDVASGKWYANAVNWAADKGLVTGYGNGKFGPDDRITREQMVAIMMQYSKMKGYDLSAKADLSKYPDQSKISKWALNAVKWGVSHKIISGTDKGLEPKGNATRAQIAVILQAYDNNLRK